MALARIITRSHSCSRELALDLIARGYAVEIVSPDSIPDNLADLELRVEEDHGNHLVASVQAHNGPRSASLEFVHHLKAPMVDFICRPPELNPDDGACPVLPPPQSPPVEPPGHVAVVVSTMARPMISKPTIAKSTIAPSVREWEWRDRPAGWPSWRTALTVVSAVLLALVLSYGVRQTNKASGQSSGPAPTEKVSLSTGVSLSSAANPKKDPGKVSALAVSPPAIKSEQNSDQTPKESHVATAGAVTAGSGATVSRRHGDDLIAPDTVTYFDQHTFDEPASRAETSQRSAGRLASSRTQSVGGVIAANTVTLNDKSAPKGAKQESDIKNYSDLK